MADSTKAWGVFPHAERRKVTARGYVVRAMESGYPVDQFNYGGIVPVIVFSYRAKRAAEAHAKAATALEGVNENPEKWRRATHVAGPSLEWQPISRARALAAIRVFGGVRVPPPGRETSVGSDQSYRYFIVNRSGKLELQRRERIGFNPRKKRSSGRRAAILIRADKAEAVFKATGQARRFGGRRGRKLPRGFRLNPAFTRQVFVFIADVIRRMPSHAPTLRAQRASVAAAFADALGATNPRFDRVRFLKAALGDDASENPLAIYGANGRSARTVRELGRVVEIRYKRNDDGQFYKHGFKTRPRLLALSDGTIAVRP